MWCEHWAKCSRERWAPAGFRAAAGGKHGHRERHGLELMTLTHVLMCETAAEAQLANWFTKQLLKCSKIHQQKTDNRGPASQAGSRPCSGMGLPLWGQVGWNRHS